MSKEEGRKVQKGGTKEQKRMKIGAKVSKKGA